MGKDSNPFEILNGYGNILELKYIEYHMSGLKTERHKQAWIDFTMKVSEYETLFQESKMISDEIKAVNNQKYPSQRQIDILREKDKINYDRRKELDEFFGDTHTSPFYYTNRIATMKVDEKEYILARLYDIKPFVHQYMINISPRWNDEHEPTDIEIELFRKCILEYLNQD